MEGETALRNVGWSPLRLRGERVREQRAVDRARQLVGLPVDDEPQGRSIDRDESAKVRVTVGNATGTVNVSSAEPAEGTEEGQLPATPPGLDVVDDWERAAAVLMETRDAALRHGSSGVDASTSGQETGLWQVKRYDSAEHFGSSRRAYLRKTLARLAGFDQAVKEDVTAQKRRRPAHNVTYFVVMPDDTRNYPDLSLIELFRKVERGQISAEDALVQSEGLFSRAGGRTDPGPNTEGPVD